MLRSIHPDREAQQYVPVWRGDSWRNYDFTPPPALEDNSNLRKRVWHRPKPAEDQVLAWLTDTPRTALMCALDLGISCSAARCRLGRLVAQGMARKTDGPQRLLEGSKYARKNDENARKR